MVSRRLLAQASYPDSPMWLSRDEQVAWDDLRATLEPRGHITQLDVAVLAIHACLRAGWARLTAQRQGVDGLTPRQDRDLRQVHDRLRRTAKKLGLSSASLV